MNTLTFFASVLSICFVAISAILPSPPTMVTLGAKEYYISNITDDQMLDWGEARNFCNSNNLTLAAFETLEEHVLVTDHVTNVTGDGYTFWVDGTDANQEGTWKWSSSSLNITYNAWGTGQPGTDNADEENCMGINPGEGRNNWHDIPCNDTYRFICESIEV